MTRVRDADEFARRFREITNRYRVDLREFFERQRRQYGGLALSDPTEPELEAHTRAYFVDALLAALNWRLNPRRITDTNLFPEAPLRAFEATRNDTWRRMDYLGFDSNTEKPLLLVETKRPNDPLPRLASPPEDGLSPPSASILRDGLRGTRLAPPWQDWLRQLRDYVVGIRGRRGHVPVRVVCTNGDWLIVFENPEDCFLADSNLDHARISVFADEKDMLARMPDIFRLLEYYKLADIDLEVLPGELGGMTAGADVVRIMHGLNVRRVVGPTSGSRHAAVISVTPTVVVKVAGSRWIRVCDSQKDERLPDAMHATGAHLVAVDRESKALLSDVFQQIGTRMVLTTIEQHYAAPEEVELLPGVTEIRDRELLHVVTGAETHFIRAQPSVADCRYHSWIEAYREGRASYDSPLRAACDEPPSYFADSSIHHCAHRDVRAAKGMIITAQNRAAMGPRSRSLDSVFCEIWPFETHLCCRTCVYERTCEQSSIFKLPCASPS